MTFTDSRNSFQMFLTLNTSLYSIQNYNGDEKYDSEVQKEPFNWFIKQMFEKFRKLNKKIPVMSPSIGNVQGYVGALLKY